MDEQISQEIDALRQRLYELSKKVGRSGNGTEAIGEGEVGVLTCRVGDDRVSFLLSTVDEVVPVAEMSPLPETPGWLCGLLNLRGKLVPVLDVAARVARSYRELELSDLIVVCEDQGRSIGFVVQDVFDIVWTTAAGIQLPGGDIPHGPYLLGVVESALGSVQVFSVRRLVQSSDIPEAVIEADED